MKKIGRRARELYASYNTVIEESLVQNINRIYYLSIISMIMRLIDVLLIKFGNSGEESPITWEVGIILSHLTMLLFMIAMYLITAKLRRESRSRFTMYILLYISIAVIMMGGIVITVFDQVITSNITPFILSCVVVGIVFLIRPAISVLIFLFSYLAYYTLIGIYINDADILLSNRVNGITAVALGLFTSVILWHYNYINIVQKRYIEKQNIQLEQMAYHDSLTDLPNRRMFDKLVEHEFSMMRKEGYESVLVLMDIDDFKTVNDTYGHLAGDDVLRQFAKLLRSNLRETDYIARFGGEEFILLMPSTTLEEGYAYAENLRKLIMENIFIVESKEMHLTSSIGMCKLTKGKSEKHYFCSADKALYRAKQLGKNRVVVCDLVE
jgi:diguanylate cyclase (GGDEF)-like protein